MEISFKFNNGETPAQIVTSIRDFFSATSPGATSIQIAPPTAGLAPADNDDADGPTGTPANPLTLDATGIPHDTRIHSKEPQLTGKGVWRARRNVAATTVAAVTAELKARGGSVAQPPAPAPVAPPVAPPPIVTAAPAPLAVPQLTPVAPPPIQPPGAYEKFVSFIVDNTAPAGRLTPQYITDNLAAYNYKDATGAGSLQVVQHANDAQIAQLAQAFAQALGVPSPL